MSFPHKCAGDFELGVDEHPLLGEKVDGLTIVAVRTPECENNGTDHVWILPAQLGTPPYISLFDWRYLRPGDPLLSLLGSRYCGAREAQPG